MRMEPNIKAARKPPFRNADEIENGAEDVEKSHPTKAIKDGQHERMLSAKDVRCVNGRDKSEKTEGDIHENSECAVLGCIRDVHHCEGRATNGEEECTSHV